MKRNKLQIKINKPSQEIFDFYINPKNTPLWINSYVHEETNEWPVKIGTIYKNLNQNGQWFKAKVTDFKNGKVFELASIDGNYHVRYTHTPLSKNLTKIEYFEWVDQGEIDEPFSITTLKKLKDILEEI